MRRDAECDISNSALASGAGLRHVPGAGTNGEGRTVSIMQRDLRRQGSGVRGEVRCQNERAVGRREYGCEEGAGMNRNKLEIIG